MNGGIAKLISITSEPISNPVTDQPLGWRGLKLELFDLLSEKNGFFAFESSLLVRPLGGSGSPHSLEKWNAADLWRDSYSMDLPELYFFAEDVFGGQFALTEDAVVSFDPETGAIELIGRSLEEWADALLSDYDYFTGHSLGAAWQGAHGPLSVGHRLVPRQLFVLGGEFDAGNLMCVDEVRGMRSRGFFASELKDVPEGGRISFKLVE